MSSPTPYFLSGDAHEMALTISLLYPGADLTRISLFYAWRASSV